MFCPHSWQDIFYVKIISEIWLLSDWTWLIMDFLMNEVLVVRKKNHNVLYSPISNTPQCNSFVLLGVTLQSDGKFNEHVRTKLVKANKCLHVLRTLRKEHYSQAEIDHLFISIVLPNFSYALSVYGASESDLTVIQNFLDRCHKRRFISFF